MHVLVELSHGYRHVECTGRACRCPRLSHPPPVPRSDQVMGQLHVKADPFWTKPESDLVGKSYMYLASLAYQVEIAQWLPIVDFCGAKVGELRVTLTPYEADYKTKLRPTSNPEALLNSKLAFVLRIEQARREQRPVGGRGGSRRAARGREWEW